MLTHPGYASIMTEDGFRKLALEMPEAVEASHMGHPDFRVAGKIFATIPKPGKGLGMVKLTPDEQERFLSADPKAFARVDGTWGLRGATYVRLKAVRSAIAREALRSAWQSNAPKKLIARS